MTSLPTDPIPTRASLLSRLKDRGDDASWQQFFDTYWRLIYGVALKSGLSETEAQDVVQETLVGVAKNIHEFRSDPARGSFKAWLLKLTRWRIMDQIRKRPAISTPPHSACGTARTSTVERIVDPNTIDMEQLWEREWKTSLAETALERLKPRVKPRMMQIHELHILRGWSAPKVARHLGVTVFNVYITAHRVNKLLRQEVQRLEQRSL